MPEPLPFKAEMDSSRLREKEGLKNKNQSPDFSLSRVPQN
jgi:hypothetical protein